MNTDKAYLLGLMIGGGIFGTAEDVFRIRLPYKKWGSYIDIVSKSVQSFATCKPTRRDNHRKITRF